ncbi:MAG TPA: hypothetical protein VGR64_07690 [Terracidiphilus sp.]|nr:hypothetical protein [Terracidiphilus sp.]
MNASNVIWIITFAAELVLLVVLLGRERIQRFPWFTASIAVMALRLMTAKLLNGRLPQITMVSIFILLADLSAILTIAVLIEIARRSFAGAGGRAWAMGATILALPGIATLALWGKWPPWATLATHSQMAMLGLGQLVAQKLGLFGDVTSVALCVAVVLLGARFGAGHRSHTQQLVVGLAAAALSQIGVQATWEFIAKTAAPHTMAEYQHVLAIRDRLFDANGVIYSAVILWWIVCLWFDEPGKGPSAAETSATDGSNADGHAPEEPTATAG